MASTANRVGKLLVVGVGLEGLREEIALAGAFFPPTLAARRPDGDAGVRSAANKAPDSRPVIARLEGATCCATVAGGRLTVTAVDDGRGTCGGIAVVERVGTAGDTWPVLWRWGLVLGCSWDVLASGGGVGGLGAQPFAGAAPPFFLDQVHDDVAEEHLGTVAAEPSCVMVVVGKPDAEVARVVAGRRFIRSINEDPGHLRRTGGEDDRHLTVSRCQAGRR